MSTGPYNPAWEAYQADRAIPYWEKDDPPAEDRDDDDPPEEDEEIDEDDMEAWDWDWSNFPEGP